jgi:crotonobetainyl-CoA:carnitine CoA-transferase CaiB-like acyl-CoA transferase
MTDTTDTKATSGNGPLSDIRVLDIASFMAAPMAAMWLGDFGADVVKVEHPNGDNIRTWGSTKDGIPLFWKMVGRNKRSVTLDLHHPEGQELLRQLATKVDVIVENFRPGTLDRWNVSVSELLEINPRLVVLSISAFGQSGPNSPRPGFGTLAEAISGFAHVTGQPDGPPTLPSFGLADAITGLCGAYAVMVALHERQTSGLGQHIDLAIYEPLMTILGHFFVEYDQLGVVAQRLGSRLPFSSPRNVFHTSDDRWVAMSCSGQSIFERSARAIGRPDLITDPRFIDNRARTLHSDEIDGIFQDWIGEHDQAEVLDVFTEAGAAASPIYDVQDAFEDLHFIARDNLTSVADADLGPIRMQNVTPKLSRTPGGIRHAGPRLGEHTESVYQDWLGLSPEALKALEAEGVI